MSSLVWFREQDLRVNDNSALYHACQHEKKQLIACFFITPKTWQKHDMAPCRVEFILSGLKSLQHELKSINVPLIVINVETYEKIPTKIFSLCQKYCTRSVFANHQYEPNERKRDLLVKEKLTQIDFKLFHDATIVPPDLLNNKKDEAFKVFTPYKKQLLQWIDTHGMPKVYPKPKKLAQNISVEPYDIPQNLSEFSTAILMDQWPAGEKAASLKLKTFLKDKINFYQDSRDYPFLEGTSTLSPYLATGMISIRSCLSQAVDQNEGFLNERNKGVTAWINELIWRDFYKMILLRFPKVGKNQAFKDDLNIPWEYDKNKFNAWKQGQTGFPFVDAGMRQLKTTGWMHNRLRMLTAMFLTKLLHIDWRWGEKYFMQNLIDGDLAANNGGWQWSASTGTDAVPYFRIFNPTTQSEKFDPEGLFIKKFCPELKSLSQKEVHNPKQKIKNYPQKIIDYPKARAKALRLFGK